MNSVSSCCCSPPKQFGMMQGNWSYRSVQIEKTAIAGEQSTDIEIQTADGDKLTLSSDITFASSAITYEELGRTNASYIQSRGQIVSANAKSKLELTIEGTLDEMEKKEIKEVLMHVFKMVKDFITGKADGEEISNFANLTTISEVKAGFDINTNITVAAQSAVNPTAQTAIEGKSVNQVVETANLSKISKRVDSLTDRMITKVKDSGIDPSKILKRLHRQHSWLSDKLTTAEPAVWNKMRLRQEILEDFAKKLKQLSSENEAEITTKGQLDSEMAANVDETAFAKTTSSVSETMLNVARQELHFEMEYSVADHNGEHSL